VRSKKNIVRIQGDDLVERLNDKVEA
jgi:hypothetical protein